MFRLRYPLLPAVLLALNLAGQTQVDLRTQSKGVDFQAATYTKPLRASATLPATCAVNELLLLTTAPPGANIYACVTTDNWVLESGGGGGQSLSIQLQGTAIGSRGVENFIPGTGITDVITDTGTKINIQQDVDTSVVVSPAGLQSGQALLCQSAGASPSAYTCTMNPVLTSYTTGMVLFWEPDINATGGAATLNVDLLGAAPVVKPDGTNPLTGDIVAGGLYPVWFDGTSFRMISTAGGAGGSGGSTPTVLNSTGAGGSTTITAASEWHAPLAYCSGASTPTLVWSTPPSGSAAAADGCSGTSVNDSWGTFAVTGTPSLQTSFTLPQTLTGTADVYLNYLTSTASGTFSPQLDIVCTATGGTAADDTAFTSGNFFAPGLVAAPATANNLATVSAHGLAWPGGCTAGTRAHLRLMRTDTTGSASAVGIAEVVIVLRRTI